MTDAPLPSDLANNPLINLPAIPHGAPALDVIKAEHFMPAIDHGMALAKKEIEAIKNSPSAPTFANTIEALECAGTILSRAQTIFGCVLGANKNDDLDAIEEEIELKGTRHSNDILFDEKLFSRVKAVYDMRDTLGLTEEQKVLLNETYKGFARNGALLDETGKARLREISERMSKLGTDYSKNLLKSTQAYKKVIEDEAELAGVPERAKDIYRHFAKEAGMEGKFLIQLSPPPIDILEYAQNRALREEVSRAFSGVAYKGEFDNSEIVVEMARLRQEKSNLLGFETFADFVLDNRMAKTADAVMKFLKDNETGYRPAAEEYLAKVKALAQEDGITDVKPWDVSYYARLLEEKTFNFDAEVVRPYFDLEKVLDGMRHHAEKLFNIEMREDKTGKYPVYHPDVKVYEVYDKATGEIAGLFYGDYYARPGAKQSGAWMNSFRGRGMEEGENKFPIVTNVCNFAKPAPGKPTLLSFDEVTTVFHEFGHGLHGLLAKGNYASLTGTNVKWDFVELPSQLQENWVQEKEVLDTFARHHETGELLPAELVQKLRDVQNFSAGYMGLRQTYLARLDMAWHAGDATKIRTAEELEDAVIADVWIFPREGGTMSTRFGHIFAGGYAAGYYSYKWAEVLEADVYESFKKNGLYDRATADRLRDTIYSRGGTAEPMDLFVGMMGRQPDTAALFRREGLTPPNDNSADKDAKPAPAA